jgi:hypothetical protein
MIRHSHAMTCLMAYHNKKGTEAISIVLQTRIVISDKDVAANTATYRGNGGVHWILRN